MESASVHPVVPSLHVVIRTYKKHKYRPVLGAPDGTPYPRGPDVGHEILEAGVRGGSCLQSVNINGAGYLGCWYKG